MKDHRRRQVSGPVRALSLIALLAIFLSPAARADEPAPGLILRLSAGGESDARIARTVAMYVPKGHPVSPFLKEGPFKATFEGTLNLEKRSRLVFTLVGTGKARLLIDDEVLVEEIGVPNESKRLSSGEHKIVCEYESPADGDAELRLYWEERDFSREPVPASAFTHNPADELLARGQDLRVGRAVVAEKRCTACHDAGEATMPELKLAAPSLDGVGERLRADWLVKWIADPQEVRPSAHMPVVFKENAAQSAADITSYLTAGAGEIEGALEATPEQVRAGGELFHQQGCVACHTVKGAGDAERIGLEQVGKKFRLGALAGFLREPSKFHEATRMPTFNFSEKEAAELAGFLRSLANDPGAVVPTGDAEKGKALFASSGCADCHARDDLKSSRPLAPALGALAAPDCKAVTYTLTAPSKRGLESFLTGKAAPSLARSVPAEFAHRQFKSLRCDACHQRDGAQPLREQFAMEVDHLKPPAPPVDEGHPALKAAIPPLNHLGFKVRPEWRAKLFAGEITPKTRPWMKARMPAFPSRAQDLAAGFSHAVGLPATSPELAAIDPAKAKIGEAMIGIDGGLACGTCHGIGAKPPIAVFEGEGPNFKTAARLHPEYFQLWMTDPPRVWPGTIMPKYAVDGKTPLTQHYDGDAAKQFEAIYEYLRTFQEK